MLRVGLTGGIGAGKSTVSRRLAEHGAVVVDADLLAREVVEPGTDGLAAVVEAFGDGVLTADGTLDRPALGAIVFADDAARTRLNGILHPRIGALTLERFAAAPPDAVLVHDVPLLVEGGMAPNYHLVVVVHAPAEERVRRLVAERGMPEADARARIASQADDDARRAVADVWLDNSGARDDVLAAVDRLWTDRLLPFERALRERRAPAPAAGAEPEEADVERALARLRRSVGERAEARAGAAAGVARTAGSVARRLVEVVASEQARTAELLDALHDAGFVATAGDDPWTSEWVSADPEVPLHLRFLPQE